MKRKYIDGRKKVNKAIVTGASSGIGKAIVDILISHGYEVYGIGRHFENVNASTLFHPIVLDLLDEKEADKVLKTIPVKDLQVLINNAGCAYYGLHENIKREHIQEMVRLNLEVPMELSRRYLKVLRENRGDIINIASVSGMHEAAHGASYGASKAGLIAFSKSLFAEERKHGVRVMCVIPDMTDTNLYRNADFEADTNDGCCLMKEDVAEIVCDMIFHKNFVTSEIVIQPQFHRIHKK